MSLYDDVYREALHDWLDERKALLADELPSRSELEERHDEQADDWFVVSCVVVGGLYSLALHLQERRRKALEATERWHCPSTLPEDWNPVKEIR